MKRADDHLAAEPHAGAAAAMSCQSAASLGVSELRS